MSLCFSCEFEKNIILGLTATAITLVVGLVLMQVAHGQNQFPKDEVQMVLGYCYLHADRLNPVQDLLDKGLVSANFAGETCGSVKQAYDEEKNRIREEIANRTATLEDARIRYHDCKADENKNWEECESIAKEGGYNQCLAEGKLFSECFKIYEETTR